MEPKSKLSGPNRAAVFLMSLGEEAAAEVLRHMGPKEVQSVGTAMASLTNVSKSDVAQVVDDFVATVDEQTALGMGSDDYIRSVLNSALGKDKADGVIDRILLGRNSKGLESLKWMDPRAVAEVIRLEHPQIIAIVLSYLDPDHAASVLSFLPDRTQPDILMRIATLDGVQPTALQELDEILERQFAGNMNVKSSSVGGIKSAATILNFMDSSKEGSILDKVRDVDEGLSQKIQDLMFVFGNLADLDDRSIQSLLRELSTDSLVMALKGADENLKDRIFKNMSKRAGEMLQDDLEAKGPVRLSEVETAQKEILGIARRMAEAGEIVLGNKGSEQMV
ncbi:MULTISPECIES: flagellar motor switch protein FliG [unclassified Ectothiorhodospira]|uniref:flagellar motor switch protein FliG n=1 Tax=unclassified Ectothiorhodospira TaxID=2684909 RepID=UPI001EE8DE39|nr:MULTISPECIES: flagellar motor switch protein FliG [unclassified Ectothiorhodospira]MCG5515010.1 flagellar motor switch protein FliG [Ectothiorhodospira sp. 9100]MCG5517666.1 flagellar motor switch protein FliG [Ectothiorhodospira sp. 9905]